MSLNGDKLSIGAEDGKVYLLDLKKDNAPVELAKVSSNRITSIDFNSNASKIVNAAARSSGI